MLTPSPIPPIPAAPPPFEPNSEKARTPAWIFSFVFHLVAVLTIAASVRPIPRGLSEEARTGGIVLVRESQGKLAYFSDAAANDPLNPQANSTSAANVAGGSNAPSWAQPQERPPLPDLPGLPQAGKGQAIGLPGVGELLEGAGNPGYGASSSGIGGEVETGIFGLIGKGTKFVFVIDRSGSMGDAGGRPMQAARNELIAGVNKLGQTHQFQIVFYNEKPLAFNPLDWESPRMLFATDANKRSAETFIRGVPPAGNTRHLAALLMGVSMAPDVLFFLTDAQEPQLSDYDLDRVRKANSYAQAVIHAVEFGTDPEPLPENFLVRLARQNGGNYAYVDIKKLAPR